MRANSLNLNYFELLPFEMVLNYPHIEGYDPVEVIEQYWQNHDVNTSRDYIVFLFLKAIGKEVEEPVKDFDKEEIKAFSLELLHLLVAYYLCHIHNIDLKELNVPNHSTGEISDQELLARQANYALFGNMKPKDKD